MITSANEYHAMVTHAKMGSWVLACFFWPRTVAVERSMQRKAVDIGQGSRVSKGIDDHAMDGIRSDPNEENKRMGR